jgi:hypothetical protein
MHDSQLEDQVRSLLRTEGDGIPLTITAAELERRLAARRRATGGRRLSLVAAAVAAIMVGTIVAAGNGWLRLPAIGTVPSPDASATPSAEPVTRIERGDGDLILEVEPTWSGTGASPSIEKQLVPTDYVVSIRVACIGAGIITFEERDRAVTEPCERDARVPRAPDAPIVHRIPTSVGYLSVRFTVSAAVNYTILVETIPLPDRLPAMSAPDGIVDIDANSDSDRPATGMPGATRSVSVGVVPASSAQRLALVCLGSGVLEYSLGPDAEPASAITGEVVCDGVPQLDEFSLDAAAANDLRIKTEVRTAWHVMASHDLPGSAPSATLPPGRAPIGRPGQAILVQPIGASWTTPDSLEVTLYDQVDSTSEVIATLPGSVVPAGKWLSTSAKPVVSVTGWLAIPIVHGPNATDRQPEIVIVDLLDPTAAPKSIAGVSSGSWSADDTFAAIAENGEIQLYHPATGALEVSPIQDPAVSVATLKAGTIGAPANDPIWTSASDSRFVGMRQTYANPPSGSDGWGAISADGSFTATTDLPPTYQRTGLERPAGANAHGLQMACTGSGTILESGCTLMETGTGGEGVATRVTTPDFAYLADFAWAADGRDAWLLFGAGTDQGRSEGPWSLALSDPTGGRTEFAALQLGAGDPAILGLGYTTSEGGLPIVVLGSRDSWVRAFVASDATGSHGSINALDGTAWFAGWAGQQPDYDPD